MSLLRCPRSRAALWATPRDSLFPVPFSPPETLCLLPYSATTGLVPPFPWPPWRHYQLSTAAGLMTIAPFSHSCSLPPQCTVPDVLIGQSGCLSQLSAAPRSWLCPNPILPHLTAALQSAVISTHDKLPAQVSPPKKTWSAHQQTHAMKAAYFIFFPSALINAFSLEFTVLGTS